MKEKQPKVVKCVIRLSEGCLKVARGDLLDNVCSMMNFLPKSCQTKMAAQKLSRYIKVVTGLS